MGLVVVVAVALTVVGLAVLGWRTLRDLDAIEKRVRANRPERHVSPSPAVEPPLRSVGPPPAA